MIALIDYGIGNLRSVEKALTAVGGDVTITDDVDVIRAAERIVLPGVGAFGDGMAGLLKRQLVQVIEDVVCQGKPFLGICLGMQLLFESSDELGGHSGLGLLPGTVQRFPEIGLKIPHTGWNQLFPLKDSPITHGLCAGDYAYFNHGYYCLPADPVIILAKTEYGLSYSSIIGRDQLYGVQFHPEKSQTVGLQILRNFVERC